MKRIDINVDIAEGFPWDDALLDVATSANVCCGAHAGSSEMAAKTIQKCLRLGVRVGLHPGYPDREGMGRRPFAALGLSGDQLRASLEEQTAPFLASASYIKPHGALYHDDDWDSLYALVDLLDRTRLPLMHMEFQGEPLSSMGRVALIREGFSDRLYNDSGELVPRSEPGAVHVDPEAMARQAVELAPFVDSICVHGDTPGCVAAVQLVRRALERAHFEVGS